MSHRLAKLLFLNGPWDGAQFENVLQEGMSAEVYIEIDSVEMQRDKLPDFGRPERISARDPLCRFRPRSAYDHRYEKCYEEPGVVIYAWAPLRKGAKVA